MAAKKTKLKSRSAQGTRRNKIQREKTREKASVNKEVVSRDHTMKYVFVKKNGLHYRRHRNGCIEVADSQNIQEILLLEDMMANLWIKFDGTREVQRIADELVEEYEVDTDECLDFIKDACRQLASLKLIEKV